MPTQQAEAAKQKRPNIWWPNLTDEQSARFAAREGEVAALWVMIVTGLIVGLAAAVNGTDAWALVDVALFGAVAFGLHRMSRVAAVAGLLLYLYEQAIGLSQSINPSHVALLLTAAFTLAFVNAIRGTLFYHQRGLAPVVK